MFIPHPDHLVLSSPYINTHHLESISERGLVGYSRKMGVDYNSGIFPT